MKNIRDFKNIRLSKKQMGNITGGKMFRCYIYMNLVVVAAVGCT